MLVYCGGRGPRKEDRDPFMGKLREGEGGRDGGTDEGGRERDPEPEAAAAELDDAAAALAIPRMRSQKFCRGVGRPRPGCQFN